MKHTLLSLAMLLAAFAQAQKVSVYTDDFSGSHVDLGVGRYDYQSLARNGVTGFSYFKVPAGLKATLYTKNNFEGNSITITKDVNAQYLPSKGFGSTALIMPSLVIEKAPIVEMGPHVTVYKDDFTGDSYDLPVGQYEFPDIGIGNDQLSSVKIPKGLKVRLYEHSAFKGRSLELTADASASMLIKNKFNDLTSSLIVEAVPEPAKTETPAVVLVPAVMPAVVPGKTPEPEKTRTFTHEYAVTIFEGDFSGASNVLSPGKYSIDQLGIGNDQLSSIKIPKGLRVTLFENDAFDGRSLVLTGDTRAATMLDAGFNNLTSSLVVEAIPMVTIFEGDYNGKRRVLDPGKYAGVDIGVANISSVKVPDGFRVTLYEKDNFGGRSLVLTHDTGADYLAKNNFDNITSSLIVESAAQPAPEVVATTPAVPVVTLYKENFAGTSAQLGPGRYDFRDGGFEDNTLNSIRIPRGLQVTLYENGSFRGRTMILRADAAADFFAANQFNGLTTSMVVEQLPPTEIMVTLFDGVYTGASQMLGPGRYSAGDLMIGNDRLTSVKVPKGMRATLFENDAFDGRNVTFESDGDLSVSKVFDNRTSSLIIEDIFTPLVTPPADLSTPAIVPVTTTEVTTTVVTTPSCEMTAQQYDHAVKAVQSKAFRDEKMDMAKLATKGKCMSNDQIRGIAKQFSFEDQTLEFVKYAYDLSTEQSEYYTLGDMFKFLSSKDDFTEFLKTK